MRIRSAVVAATCSLGLLLPVAASAAPPFPDDFDLPTGFQPEGIATGRGTTFYAGSLANGAIIRGDLRTGSFDTIVDSADGPAVGIAVDQKNRVWVAGGPSGQIRVYDGSTGRNLALYTTEPGFINDLVVTSDAVYATNSQTSALSVVRLGRGGALPATEEASTLAMVGFPIVQGFNANGIEEWLDGRLIVANSSAQALFAVDPATGEAATIDLGGPLPFVDGITRRGNTVYAVQNRLNQIAVISLESDLSAGVVQRTLTNPAFDVPTTVALFGNATYVVNARFGTPSPTTADFAVVRTAR